MVDKATCPDCGNETEWIAEYDTGTGTLDRMPAICDGCQADRAVAAAYAGTDY